MKFNIIEDGALQPMELLLFIIWVTFIVTSMISIYVIGDLFLQSNPDIKQSLNKPAPVWLILAFWAAILFRTNK